MELITNNKNYSRSIAHHCYDVNAKINVALDSPELCDNPKCINCNNLKTMIPRKTNGKKLTLKKENRFITISDFGSMKLDILVSEFIDKGFKLVDTNVTVVENKILYTCFLAKY